MAIKKDIKWKKDKITIIKVIIYNYWCKRINWRCWSYSVWMESFLLPQTSRQKETSGLQGDGCKTRTQSQEARTPQILHAHEEEEEGLAESPRSSAHHKVLQFTLFTSGLFNCNIFPNIFYFMLSTLRCSPTGNILNRAEFELFTFELY